MAVSGAELQFLIRMRDEASSVINNVTGGLGSMGQQAGGTSTQLGSLALKVTAFNQALQASQSIIRGVTGTVRDLTSAYSEFDKSLNLVERVTRMSDAQIEQLGGSIEALAKKLQIVPQQKLAHLADEAVTIGVRGSENILKFTETMAKLDEVLGELGPGAGKTIVAVLNATGDGVQGIEKFGNVLTRLRQSTASSVESILTFTGRLAEAGAQFNLTTESMLSLAAAASEIKGLQAQRFGTSMSRTLTELRDAALQGTQGMRTLTALTGVTQEAFAKLVQEHPEQAVLLFVNALNRVQQSGRSTTALLTQFHLQSAEVSQVLGVMGKQWESFQQKLATGAQEGKDQIVVNQEWETTLKRFQSSTDAATRAWGSFEIAIGHALAPIASSALSVITSGLDTMRELLEAMPHWAQTAGVGVVAFIGIFLGLLATLKTFGAIFRTLGLGWGAQAGTGFATSFGARASGAIAASAGKIAFGLAALPLWAEAGHFIGEKIGDALTSDFVMKYMPGLTKGIAHLYGIRTDGPKAGDKVDVPLPQARPQIFNRPDVDVKAVTQVGKEDMPVLEQLDSYSKKMQQVTKDLNAIANLQKLVGTQDVYFAQHGVQGGADQEQLYVDRLRERVNLQKLLADPVNATVRGLQLQIQSAGQITKAGKDEEAVRQAILKVQDQKGVLDKDEISRLRTELELLNRKKIETAEINALYDANKALDAAKAVTREQQNQLATQQKIADLIRNQGFSPEKAAQVAGVEAATRQITQYKSLQDSIDSVGAAQRKYNDDLATLNKQLATATPEQAKYIEGLKQQLALQTLASRDPYGAIVKSQKDEISLLKITGDYQDADRKTQQALIDLRQKGVQVTKEQAAAMQEYNRAIQDAQASQNNGLEGWAKGVGSLRDNLLTLQKDFATTLSSSISDALSSAVTGKKFNWRSVLAGFGKKMVDVSVNQLLKEGFQGLGGQNLFGLGSKDALNKAGSAADKLQGLNTQAMTVTATTVSVNGQNFLGEGTKTNYSLPAGVPNAATTPPGAYSGDIKAAIDDAAKRHNVSASALATEARIESNFNPNAQAKGSSAGGLFQFTNGTAAQYGLTNKFDARASADAAARLMADNKAGLQAAGLDASDFNLYMAHQQGLGGAKKLLQNPDANAVQTLGSKAVLNNGGSSDMTNAQFLDTWRQKYEKMKVTSDQAGASVSQVDQKTIDLSAKQMQASGSTQNFSQATQSASTSLSQLDQSTQMTATNSQQASQSVQQFGQATQTAGQEASTASTQASTASGGFGSLGGALGGIMGPIGSVVGGIGKFGMGLIGLIPKLFGAIGGMGGGGGGGGLFGGLGGLFGGLFHTGGVVGTTNQPMRFIPYSALAHAPRFHSGSLNDNDEFAAVLKRGETVLTADQTAHTASVMSGLNNQVDMMARAIAANNNRSQGKVNNNRMNITVNAKDADSFRKSSSQIYAEGQIHMNRMGNRNN